MTEAGREAQGRVEGAEEISPPTTATLGLARRDATAAGTELFGQDKAWGSNSIYHNYLKSRIATPPL